MIFMTMLGGCLLALPRNKRPDSGTEPVDSVSTTFTTDSGADSGDTGTPCGPYTVLDKGLNSYSVPGVVRAVEDGTSPFTGDTLHDGMDELLAVAFSAQCVGMSLTHLTFNLEGLETADEANEFVGALSKVYYNDNASFHEVNFGDGYPNHATVNGTEVTWEVDLDAPTDVYVNDPMVVFFATDFGAYGATPTSLEGADVFRLELSPFQSWHAGGDPAIYPATVIGDAVVGPNLTWAP